MAVVARVLFALALLAAEPHAVFEAHVVKVVDGDTIHVALPGKATQKVRLLGIDAPERDQPYARQARSALSKLVYGREVRLETHGSDRFDRLLAIVHVGEREVNAELVRVGAAWVYRKYRDDEQLIALEDEARAAKRGLWGLAESERVPPWEWRHPDASPAANGTSSKPAAFRCGEKLYCREMESCAEARFYLVRCGLERIDGDGDGVPCSSLCKK